jgi:hypothetical protein
VFKAVAETINDVSAVVGSDTAAAAKLQEVVELIKDGVVSNYFRCLLLFSLTLAPAKFLNSG